MVVAGNDTGVGWMEGVIGGLLEGTNEQTGAAQTWGPVPHIIYLFV